jgi:hypothetical protein
MATDLSQFPVPSDRFDVAQRNAADLDKVINESASVSTRTGKVVQSLEQALASISAITDRGAWTTATSYQVKDLVTDSGIFYIAVIAHTSGATFAGDIANWRVFQGVTVNQGDNRYGPLFATVAAMESPSPVSLDGVVVNLTAGMTVKTQGFTTAGGSGEGPYLIEAGDTSNTTTRRLLANGNTAILQGQVTSRNGGAIADGVTDDRAILSALDALGDVELSSGLHRISSNLTFTNTVLFNEGAQLTIDTGVTVTFDEQPVASESRQIFFGLGSVATLDTSFVAWFAGDKVRTATDALTDIQKAYDACRTSGVVEWPVGNLTIPGTTAIDVSKGQATTGAGPFKSELRYSSLTCNCFDFNTGIFPSFSGLSVNSTFTDKYPTSGTVLKNSAVGFSADDFVIRRSFIGLETTARGTASNFELLDSKNIGFHPHDVNDFFIHNFIISSPTMLITVDDSAGFTIGETITGGTSGATGTVLSIESSTVINIKEINILFVAETITGGTSLEVAIISSLDRPHTLGGIRLLDKCEAIIVSQGDVIGGVFPMTTFAAVFATAVRPAFCRFTDVFFDSGDNGVQLDNSVDLTFTKCWFSNRPNDGCNVETTESIVFDVCSFVNSWKAGCRVKATAIDTRFRGCTVSGNNSGGVSESGINIAANTNDFTIQGCRLGGTLGFGTQNRGVLVNGGTSDRYIIADNLVSGNTTAGVTDAGTGVNKRVSDNF